MQLTLELRFQTETYALKPRHLTGTEHPKTFQLGFRVQSTRGRKPQGLTDGHVSELMHHDDKTPWGFCTIYRLL
jgi:hypothetical protein